MGSRYTKDYASKLKRELKNTSNNEARKFLLKWGYSTSSIVMPEYYTPINFNFLKLDLINWEKNKNPLITKTLDIFASKGYLAWRNFNFLNPYIFWHIVNEITRPKYWKQIISALSHENLVYSYSTPTFKLNNQEKLSGNAIKNWIQMAEKDLIKDCPEYDFLLVTDIRNFYPSIYTHSISWALHTKIKAREKKHDSGLLGNRLDKLFQNSRDGQTNGIPTGSMVSDIIAEIILTDIDNKLSKKIKENRLVDKVLICRYRDDYRILSRTEDHGKQVLRFLSRILENEYNLYLNSNKTHTHYDVIEGSFRPWLLEIKRSYLLRDIYYSEFSKLIDADYLKDCLIAIYEIQKKFPDSRASISILSKLSKGLARNNEKKSLNYNNIPEIISLLRKITLLREEATPHTFIILDILLSYIKTKKKKIEILNTIKQAIIGKNDQDYQLIWFYRLCLSHAPEMCKYILKKGVTPLLRIVNKNNYKFDYEIFEKVPFSKSDMLQLRKFLFINRKKLLELKSAPISISSMDPFANRY